MPKNETESRAERKTGNNGDSPEPPEPLSALLPSVDDEDIEALEAYISEDMPDVEDNVEETHDPLEAEEEGLSYTPPSDPAVMPSSESGEGAEIAAGFAQSVEEAEPSVEALPERVENNDLDLEEQACEALRLNSETVDLAPRIAVRVRNGIVHLVGTVPAEEDLARVYGVVSDLEAIQGVESHLRVVSRPST